MKKLKILNIRISLVNPLIRVIDPMAQSKLNQSGHINSHELRQYKNV